VNQFSSALVVGASRGIGLAMTQILLARPGMQSVCATYRTSDTAAELLAIEHDRLIQLKAEVTDEASLDQLAENLRQTGTRPEVVVHCAGILHEPGLQPEKSLRQCRSDALERIFAVNSIGPLLVAKAVIPLMPKKQPTHFAALSAMVGSISDNRLGGWYGYRASKAALNQLMRTLSIECRRTHPGLCVTAIHPGTTNTGLSAPFQTNVKPGKLYSPQQSAARILDVVLSGQPEESGRFMNWDGKPIPF
jgi:NAD(P)-dependent dehydrogenase (short-subunit alcohol dehydrogenase family)